MAGTYPNYTGNTQDTKNDIPGRTDIANAADYNLLDREVLIHQGELTRVSDIVDSNSFISFGDTPASYTNQGAKGIRVNAAENALEFYGAAVTRWRMWFGI